MKKTRNTKVSADQQAAVDAMDRQTKAMRELAEAHNRLAATYEHANRLRASELKIAREREDRIADAWGQPKLIASGSSAAVRSAGST